MATKTRDLRAKPGTWQEQPLQIGIGGPPGGGKTGTALRIAKGIQRVRGGRIKVLDTEGRRAAKFLQQRIGDSEPMEFDHLAFLPPHGSDDYREAIKQNLEDAACIVIDTGSDEHEGEGGMLDAKERWVDRFLDEKERDDWKARDRVSQAAWAKVKPPRTKLCTMLYGLTVPVIWTFRAREKTKPVETVDDRGRKRAVPTKMGWTPIAPAELIHAMDVFMLLPPRAEGRPRWQNTTEYEDFVLKLPEWFKPIFEATDQVTELHGELMAKWAKTGALPGIPDRPAGVPGAAVKQPVSHESSAAQPAPLRRGPVRHGARGRRQAPGGARRRRGPVPMKALPPPTAEERAKARAAAEALRAVRSGRMTLGTPTTVHIDMSRPRRGSRGRG